MIVGHLVGLGAAVTLVGTPPGAGAHPNALISSALVGGAATVTVGAAQWPALRRAFAELRVQEWILASGLGGALVGMLAMGAITSGPYDASSLPTVLLAALMFGLIAGGILGAMQAWALRRRPRVAIRWCLANAAGWALGLLLVVAGVLGAVLGPDVSGVTVATMTVGVAVMGAIIAWMTVFARGTPAPIPLAVQSPH